MEMVDEGCCIYERKEEKKIKSLEEDEILIWWGPIPAKKIERERKNISRERGRERINRKSEVESKRSNGESEERIFSTLVTD